MEHVGIDLHLTYSEVCWLTQEGEVRRRQQIRTTLSGLRGEFRGEPAARVIVESSSLTPWVARQLGEMGHEVVVVNPRRMRLIAESTLKSDRLDAEILARIGRLDLGLLRPVYQRSRASQHLRMRLRVRTSLVRSRTALINTVRGLLRASGVRLGSCTARRFALRFVEMDLPGGLGEILEPMVATIAELSERIATLDQELRTTARSRELFKRLQTTPGVGPLVALSFVAWMDRPERFSDSRLVGACLGLRPRVRDSGGRQCRGSITREGDGEMRRMLVQAAHAALNCRKRSRLKQWAEALTQRIGKKKALVALARKISVVLHRLWITGERFQPFPKTA